MTVRAATSEPIRRTAWGVVGLSLAVLLAFSAQAARRGWEASAPIATIASPLAVPTPVAARPAASTQAVVDLPAPAEGTTGTTALPALPSEGLALPTGADLGVVAARPFSLGHASRTDRARALKCLTAAVYFEAASEPDAGQAAVAQVVLNRARHPAFPSTVCGVVYQGSERAGCQFSFACDGSMQRHPPSARGWARAARAAAAALKGKVFAPVGLATHYHTFAVTPAWNRALVMTDAVGAHFFHRWKGWWGTPAAFRQHYAGGEPLPGPHIPLVATPTPVIALAAPVSPVATRPMTPAATIQPAYRSSGVALTAPADDHLPPASTILPEWRDSGRPLR